MNLRFLIKLRCSILSLPHETELRDGLSRDGRAHKECVLLKETKGRQNKNRFINNNPSTSHILRMLFFVRALYVVCSIVALRS